MHDEDKEHLAWRRACRVEPLALLAGAGDAESPVGGVRQPASEREGGPVVQPVVDILIGESPEGAQERDQQQGFLAVGTRRAAGAARQGRRTATVGKAHGETAQIEQMQRSDEGQGGAVQGTRLFLEPPLI